MKKILILIPVLCFLTCLGIVIIRPPVPDGPPGPVPEADAPTELLPPVLPTVSPYDPDGEVPPPQRTAFPLTPGDENFCREMFFPVASTVAPNNELQHYHPGQVRIEDNRLLFTADLDGSQYLSGRAESITSFLYGSVTFRVNSIETPGFFPAIWLLPTGSSRFPEVDIYEHVGRSPDVFHGVMHFINEATGYQDRQYFKYTFEDPLNIPPYYTLTFDWTPDAMRWYLDGVCIHTMTEHIPQEPMYLIFNMAVGGDACGNPEPDTPLPVTFEVEVLDFQPREIYTR